jgi:hypothetical protein
VRGRKQKRCGTAKQEHVVVAVCIQYIDDEEHTIRASGIEVMIAEKGKFEISSGWMIEERAACIAALSMTNREVRRVHFQPGAKLATIR